LIGQSQPRHGKTGTPAPIRNVEGREWWLWGFVVAVTLGLTFGIVSLTIPGFQWSRDELYTLSLREWVRGLAGLVLLFDIYSIYQHLQLQRTRRRLWEREQLFHLITENAVDMIGVIDRDGRRLYNSPAYEKVLGYSGDELAATSSLEQVHPDDRGRVLEAAEKAYRTRRGDRLEYRIRHKDGSWRVLESTASAIPARDGGIGGLVIVNRDITERKQAEALLEHRAFHDELTNLPNRLLLLDRLQRVIAVSVRHPDFKFAVLFIDIDNFKVVNDSLGHLAGDELIIQIARRLKACLRSADTVARERSQDASPQPGDTTVARPGGDKFVVLAAELRDPSDAIRMSNRIQERLAMPFAVNGQEIVISASIGIIFGGSGAATSEDVLRDAEIAMYRAKSRGKGHCEVFDSAMQANAVKRLQLETSMRKAIEAGEFQVFYQPIVSLESGRIIGLEALTRWARPEGILPPSEFIQVATETGLIIPMNRGLLRQACDQVCRWQSQFPSNSRLGISINVTSAEFAQSDLALQTGSILKQTGIDPACVTFEITETIAMADAEQSLSKLIELDGLGVRLSLDDFGTGFSSLCRLQQFPFHSLKIDRSFISDALHNSDTREIVRIIIMLAHNLRLKVVAEGIEDGAQLAFLEDLRCEFGQGYLFSKPADAITIEQLLIEQDEEGHFLADRLKQERQPQNERKPNRRYATFGNPTHSR
jgi:PAS domain S-box-containing protein